jgi:hypothetical protein
VAPRPPLGGAGRRRARADISNDGGSRWVTLEEVRASAPVVGAGGVPSRRGARRARGSAGAALHGVRRRAGVVLRGADRRRLGGRDPGALRLRARGPAAVAGRHAARDRPQGRGWRRVPMEPRARDARRGVPPVARPPPGRADLPSRRPDTSRPRGTTAPLRAPSTPTRCASGTASEPRAPTEKGERRSPGFGEDVYSEGFGNIGSPRRITDLWCRASSVRLFSQEARQGLVRNHPRWMHYHEDCG